MAYTLYGKAVVATTQGLSVTYAAVGYPISGGALKYNGADGQQSVTRQVILDPQTGEPTTVVTSARTIRMTLDCMPLASATPGTKDNALKGVSLPAIQSKVTLADFGDGFDGEYNFTGEGTVSHGPGAAKLTMVIERYPDGSITADQLATAAS